MLAEVVSWIDANKEWVFGGVGIALAVWRIVARRPTRHTPVQSQTIDGAGNIQAGRDINVAVAPMPSAPSRDVVAALEPTMADLFAGLRATLGQHPLICEFFVLPTRTVILGGSSVPRFRLNADEIPDLMNKLQILEGHGLIRDVTPKDAPMYRMSEDFVERLLKT